MGTVFSSTAVLHPTTPEVTCVPQLSILLQISDMKPEHCYITQQDFFVNKTRVDNTNNKDFHRESKRNLWNLECFQ